MHDAAPPAPAPPGRRLLLIDDDLELCELAARFLAREGLVVELAHDGERGLDRARSGDFDLVVLDVMLPGIDGFEVLRRLRESKRTPVLMLTARGDHVDRVVGLEMGADDYVPKPFDPRELTARIRAILRRANAPAPGGDAAERLQVGTLEVDPGSREAWVEGRALALTPVEFDMLAALMRSAGRLLTRDQLSRVALDRPLDPDDRSVDMHISNLRRKLGTTPDGASVIRTVRSAGYLLSRPTPAGPR